MADYPRDLTTEDLINIMTRDFTTVNPKPKSLVKRILNKFRDHVIKETKESPMGISQWREHGKKYAYWNYFRAEISMEVFAQVERIIPEYSKHNKWCECLEDENMPCDCGVSHHNVLAREFKKNINKLKELYK